MESSLLRHAVQRQISLGMTYVIAIPEEVIKERESTKIKKKLFLEMLERSYGRITVTAQHTDISRATYYHWLKTDREFKSQVQQALSDRGTAVRDMLMTKAMEGNISALTYLDKKFNKTKRLEKSEVHIFHHTNKKEVSNEKTFEDVVDTLAMRMKIASEERAASTKNVPPSGNETIVESKLPWE